MPQVCMLLNLAVQLVSTGLLNAHCILGTTRPMVMTQAWPAFLEPRSVGSQTYTRVTWIRADAAMKMLIRFCGTLREGRKDSFHVGV